MILSKARTLAGRAIRSVFSRWPVNVAGLQGFGGQASDRLQLAGMDTPASSVLWFYAALTARMDEISQVPLRISDDSGNIITGGELHDLLAKPNLRQDQFQFLAEVEAHLTTYNRAHILAISEEGRNPDELIAICPRHLTPVSGTHKASGIEVLIGWDYRNPITGHRSKYMWDEVVSIMSPNPDNPLKPISPLGPLKRSIQMDIATREQNLALFVNGGLTNFVLQTDQRWTKEQASEWLELWQDRFNGVSNAYRPAILYGGLKLNSVGLKPDELQSVNVLQTLTPQEIVAGLRVKPIMAGLTVGENNLSQGTSTQEQKVAWWDETGLAELARISGALQRFLVDLYQWKNTTTRSATPTFSERATMRRQMRRRSARRVVGASRGLELWFDTDQIVVLVEHRRTRIAQFSELRTSGYLPNDINEFLDLGLPDHPTNVGVVAFNLQPVTDVGEPEEGSRAAKDKARSLAAVCELGGKRENPDAGLLAALDKLSRAFGSREDEEVGEVVTPKEWEGLKKAFEAFVKPREKQAATKATKFFLEQRGRVLSRIKSERAAKGETRANDDEPLVDEVFDTPDQAVEHVFPMDEENPALVARFAPLWTEHLQDGWEFFNEEQGLANKDNPFSIDDPRAQAAIESRKFQGTKINDTTEGDLRNIFSDAFSEGWTIDQTEARIAEYYADKGVGADKVRPRAIAETQTTGIVNQGRLTAALNVGGLSKGWLQGSSAMPRVAHSAAQSKYLAKPIGLDEDFSVNGHAAEAPGSPRLPAAEVVHCTCMLTFVAAKTSEG